MLTFRRAGPRPVLAVLAVSVAVYGCRAKEETRTAQAPPTTAVTTPPAMTTNTTTTTTLPPPPPVWRGLTWGQKKAAVLAAFPGEAQRLPQPVPFGQTRPGTSDLAIPSFESDGTQFRVLFGFAGAALNRIQLSAAKAASSTCEDVEKRLTEELGAPSSRGDTATSLQTHDVTWTRPAETITLACAEKPSLGFRTVTVDYVATTPATPAAAAN
jgi:hypothetical protein